MPRAKRKTAATAATATISNVRSHARRSSSRRVPYRADRINSLFSYMLGMKRDELGLSVRQMAVEVGCSPSTIVYCEEPGRRAFFPRPDLAHAIALGYDLSLDDLLEAAFWSDIREV